MAENEKLPFRQSDIGGATIKPPRFIITINSPTIAKSELGGYIYSNPAEVLEIVLENVLCFLTSIEDRNAASLVCKSWYRAEALTRLDINVFNCYAVSPLRVIHRFGGRVTSVAIEGKAGWLSSLEDCVAHFNPWVNSMMETYRWLEKVCLKGMLVTNDDLGVVARSFPNFKELVLVSCEGFGTRGLGIVASECKQIRVLELTDSEVDSDDEDWMSCFPESHTCLESFLVDCVYCPTNFEVLERLVTRSPSLKKLSLSCDVSISQLHRLIVRAPQLTHLGTGRFGPEVLYEQDYADFAAGFAACKSLECLSGFMGIVPDYLPAIVPVCANLTSLDLSNTSIDADELKSVIIHCHKLHSLQVSDSVSNEGLEAVAATCKDLREFRLHDDDVGLVSDVGLFALFEGCRKLQCFKYECYGMTNAVLVALSKNCPDLRVLCIWIMGRKYVEALDEGIGAIVKNCKKITRLKVRGLLTDRAFQYIGEYGNVMQTLSFDFSGDSDMGLKYVVEGCSKLKKLTIIDCPFGDSALSGGSHSYYNMKFFLCMKSGRVSRAGCEDIARLLLEKFGLDAHVMLHMFDNPSPPRSDLDRRCYDFFRTYGTMKIYLKRR